MIKSILAVSFSICALSSLAAHAEGGVFSQIIANQAADTQNFAEMKQEARLNLKKALNFDMSKLALRHGGLANVSYKKIYGEKDEWAVGEYETKSPAMACRIKLHQFLPKSIELMDDICLPISESK